MKPMLAAKTDGKNLQYPMLASPKLDGVRATVQGGKVYSRTLKLIPNRHVQATLGRPILNGWDGELIVGAATHPNAYSNTTSGVMSEDGTPPFTFHAFDRYDMALPFYRRLDHITQNRLNVEWLDIVPHAIIENETALLGYEQDVLAAGYEGVMLRHPEGPYKFGRSTEREGWLMKLKRFNDSEAEILEIVELMHNNNEAKTNALGKTERSSHKANKRGGGTMGSLHVRDVQTGVVFDIGTGFDAATRADFWKNRGVLLGRLIKYKFFAGGVVEKPRFPVFLGFRDRSDM